ncbi:MAG: hypothetical protein JJE18_01810 [Eubacteriaceae bacterium]|nr:hypothetical protein [Eubacteriaceae bacterium]
MNEEEYLSVQEFSELIGKTYQSVYKRLDNSLKPYVKEFKGKKVISIRALEKYNMEIPQEFIEEEFIEEVIIENKTMDSNTILNAFIGTIKQLETKDRQISEKDERLKEKDRQISEKDKQISEKDEWLKEKDKRLSEKDEWLKEKDKQISEKDERLKDITQLVLGQ